MRRIPLFRLAASALLALTIAACGGAAANPDGSVTLRLGYFPNITHAAAIGGVEKGFFAKALGSAVTFQTRTFNAGPEAVEALFAGALDVTYIGPTPTVNAYARSHGEAVRVIAGATSGGAALVVQPSIVDAAGLKGKRLATPQRGNTQDVALRTWLAKNGLKTTLQGGGDVAIIPQANAQTLEAFRAGAVHGAWVPEPWATRLVLEGGGDVLVDEADLWPGGRFVTTHVIVRTRFLRDHPDVVRRLLGGHVQATRFVNTDAEAKIVVNAAISKLTGKALAPAVIAKAWSNLTFTVDPIASSVASSAVDAIALGLLEQVDLRGLYQLGPLNSVLSAAGAEEVAGL